MLKKFSLGGRDYQQIYDEAQKLIPAYSKEWTNWNLSDPGVTVLQSLAYLSAELDKTVETTSEADIARLLALFGFPPVFARPARLVLFLLLKEHEVLPKGTPFLLRGLHFELEEETSIPAGGIKGIWHEQGEKQRDVSGLINAKSRLTLFDEDEKYPFTLYMTLSHGAKRGEKLRLYVEAGSKFPRNKAEDGGLPFAEISWEALCGNGFTVCAVHDGTFCFTQSGVIEVTIPGDMSVQDGAYHLRAAISRHEYDVLPEISRIWRGHAELVQTQTLSRCIRFDTAPSGSLTLSLPFWGVETADLLVLGRDESGSFRQYYAAGDKPRSYALINKNGVYYVHIRCKKMPSAGKDSVRVLIRRPESLPLLELGSVIGYDGQSFTPEWPGGNYPAEGARLMLRQKYGEKTVYEDVDTPGCNVCCNIDPSGAVTVKRAATDGDNMLFFSQLSLTRSEIGNLRKESLGERSPGGFGGKNPGGAAQSLAALTEELELPRIAVTVRDYERLALKTPGLCLEAASAQKNESGVVQIAVKPHSEKPCPKLSALQSGAIAKYMEERRLLNVKIEIIPARWVSVEIETDVSVYPQAVSPESQIAGAIKNGVKWGEFGAAVSYGKIHALLDALDCVEFVPRLKIRAGEALDDNIRQDFATIFYLKSLQINCDTLV